ncbi:MAG TPA: hypothetical protein PLZ55_04155 [bacterium]|nr:hypothetical protein [bacterium]
MEEDHPRHDENSHQKAKKFQHSDLLGQGMMLLNPCDNPDDNAKSTCAGPYRFDGGKISGTRNP